MKNLTACWLLRQLRSMPDNFDTYDALSLASRTLQDNSDAPVRITVKKMSGKLNRLCCMGFLARTKVKRVAIKKDGHPCYRGYKYTYRVTKQGHSYIRYKSAKVRPSVGRNVPPGSINNHGSGPPSPSPIEQMVNFMARLKVMEAAADRENQLMQALQENHMLKDKLRRTESKEVALLATIVASARKVVEDRNLAIRKLADTLLDVLNRYDRHIAAEIQPTLNAALESANNIPGWMR